MATAVVNSETGQLGEGREEEIKNEGGLDGALRVSVEMPWVLSGQI